MSLQLANWGLENLVIRQLAHSPIDQLTLALHASESLV